MFNTEHNNSISYKNVYSYGSFFMFKHNETVNFAPSGAAQK